MNNLLVVSLQGLGNALLVLPSLQHLKYSRPEIKVDLLVREQGVANLLQNETYINDIFILPKGKRLLTWLLNVRRERSWSKIMLSYPSGNRSSLLCLVLPSMQRWICSKNHISRLVRSFYSVVEATGNDSEKNLIIVQKMFPYLQGDIQEFNALSVDIDELIWAKNYYRDRGIGYDSCVLGMHPGSGGGLAGKRWPAERFRSLAQIKLEEGNDVAVFLGPNEYDLGPYFKDIDKRIVIIDKLSLRQVAVLMKKLCCFVSNDSGLMHLAAFMKTPVIGIFGPTDPLRTAPIGENSLVVQADLKCQPCYSFDKRAIQCSINYYCLDKISVQQISEKIDKIIKSNK